MKLRLVTTNSQMHCKCDLSRLNQIVFTNNCGDLLGFCLSVCHVSLMRSLEVSLFGCGKSQLGGCQFAELEFVHAKGVRIRGFNAAGYNIIRILLCRKDLKEAVLSVEWSLRLCVLSELLKVDDSGWLHS